MHALAQSESVMFYACRINELGDMDCSVELERATSTCPRRPEIYYFAARLELSRASSATEGESARGGKDNGCGRGRDNGGLSATTGKGGVLSAATRRGGAAAAQGEGLDGGSVNSCEVAVEWLVKCVRNYYSQLPEQLSTKEVLILYR